MKGYLLLLGENSGRGNDKSGTMHFFPQVK